MAGKSLEKLLLCSAPPITKIRAPSCKRISGGELTINPSGVSMATTLQPFVSRIAV
jgi:hypothetical protein